MAVLRPHIALPGLLQLLSLVSNGLSELFSVGFISNALEELNTLLSFQVFKSSVVLYKGLLVGCQLNILKIDEALLSSITSLSLESACGILHGLNSTW